MTGTLVLAAGVAGIAAAAPAWPAIAMRPGSLYLASLAVLAFAGQLAAAIAAAWCWMLLRMGWARLAS